MAIEHGWSAERKKEEWVNARIFLESMGLPVVERAVLEKDAKNIFKPERGFILSYVNKLFGPWTSSRPISYRVNGHNRAQFTPQELEGLRLMFADRVPRADGSLRRDELRGIINELGLLGNGTKADGIIADILGDGTGESHVHLDEFLDVSTVSLPSPMDNANLLRRS